MPRVSAAGKAHLEETRRAQILEAATRVFARRGFDAATISDVARAAKLAEGSLYNYFRSKEDLLIHIPQHLMRPALVPLLEALPRPQTAAQLEQLLLRVAHGIVERVLGHVAFLKVFLSALPRLSPEARQQFMQLLPLHAAETLEQILRDARRRGICRARINPEIAARALPAQLMGIVMIQEILFGRRIIPYTYAAIIPEVVRIYLHGITPEAAISIPVRSRAPVRSRSPARSRSKEAPHP